MKTMEVRVAEALEEHHRSLAKRAARKLRTIEANRLAVLAVLPPEVLMLLEAEGVIDSINAPGAAPRLETIPAPAPEPEAEPEPAPEPKRRKSGPRIVRTNGARLASLPTNDG